MEDSQIMDLYWKRNEYAIIETDRKYGALCHSIAMNLLSVREDAEECVNDTWNEAWNRLPPQRPENFKAWLCRVVRNISINLWRRNHAEKRYNGINQILDELEECVPAARTVEQEIEDAELGRCISAWLLSLPKEDRALFVHRYWHGTALNELAEKWNIPAPRLTKKMYRLRLSLKATLEKEDIYL
ncbi:MAG: sigma-70 family RNA polymerase sigma factor [Firmicutes bacterium]|nr:sigma-70 family RNA polymerase sigma factor [Bacillota bacterium]